MGFKIENGILVKYTYNVLSKSDVVVPDTVKKIGAKAFSMCTGVKTITLPLGITEIGNEAFKGCSNLEKINLPGGITKIGGEAFRNCSSLKSLSLPVGMKQINEYMFCNCTGLKDITLPEGITKIEVHAFYGCKSLESINIPPNVTELCDFVFCGCSSLTYVVVPDSVVRIGGSAFWGCSSLEEIKLSNNITEIGDHAFRDCVKLNNLVIPDSVSKIGKEAFSDCPLLEISLPDDYHNIRGSFVGYKIKKKNDFEISSSKNADEIPGEVNQPLNKAVAINPDSKQTPSKTTQIREFTHLTKPKYYSPGSMLMSRNIQNLDISCTAAAWERVPITIIEKMILTSDYEANMYLPMKYSIVAAKFIQLKEKAAELYIWQHASDFICYFINVNDYTTVKALFESGKFVTSDNIIELLECAVDKVQNGGDMKIQVLINNYYMINSGFARTIVLHDEYTPEQRTQLHNLDMMENIIDDIRNMIISGSDSSQIMQPVNQLFGILTEFRDTLPNDLSELFDSFSPWKNNTSSENVLKFK